MSNNNLRIMKGQFWSFDVIFAIIIFSVVLVIITLSWNNISNQISLSYGNNAELMQIQAASLARTLLLPGTPTSWNTEVNTTNTITWSNLTIGLTDNIGDNNISSSKLYTFIAMANYNYSDTKSALGIGYDYYITISNEEMNITIGENPNTYNALDVYSYRESGSLNNMPVMIDVMLWTSQKLAV